MGRGTRALNTHHEPEALCECGRLAELDAPCHTDFGCASLCVLTIGVLLAADGACDGCDPEAPGTRLLGGGGRIVRLKSQAHFQSHMPDERRSPSQYCR